MVPASKDYSQDCSLEIQITIVAIVTIVTIVTIVKHHIIVIVIHCTGSFPIVIQHSADCSPGCQISLFDVREVIHQECQEQMRTAAY